MVVVVIHSALQSKTIHRSGLGTRVAVLPVIALLVAKQQSHTFHAKPSIPTPSYLIISYSYSRRIIIIIIIMIIIIINNILYLVICSFFTTDSSFFQIPLASEAQIWEDPASTDWPYIHSCAIKFDPIDACTWSCRPKRPE